MDQQEISYHTDTGDNIDKGDTNNTIYVQNINGESKFFPKDVGTDNYYELISNNYKIAKLVIKSQSELNKKANKDDNLYQIDIKSKNNSKFEEIILILDFNNLTEKLDIYKLESLITKFLDYFEKNNINTKLSLIIENCLIEDKEYEPLLKDRNPLRLNKLVISDELYSFSPYIKDIFRNVRAKELVLKKFKFNSKSQLSDFSDFIINSLCNKLTLDDFFIELIIKKDEYDVEYNDLDIYFSLQNNFISFNHTVSDINSLTLRDCPLFAIIGDMFSKNPLKKHIDIDQNSLLNPGIITKFKTKDGKNDICFDLDSFKIRLEEEGKLKDYDYLHYLNYIFNIIIPNFNNKVKDFIIEEDIEDSGTKNIPKDDFHRLVFKNFDTSKYEYITGEDVTYIDEENWVLNEEENKRKERFEKFEEIIDNLKNSIYPEVKELVFDNCANYFIEWVIKIFKGSSIIQSDIYHFDVLKIKKCGNGYVDISQILKMKINKLILFDTPLIIGEKFPEKGQSHLQFVTQSGKLGNVDNLTIKINSLDCYGREYNLNVMKTYEILIEILECENYYKNLIMEMNALSNIMTYLAYKTYVKDQLTYNDPNSEEKGLDEVNLNEPKGQDLPIVFEENVKYLPKYFFLSSKSYRDYLCHKAFKLKLNLTTPLIIKNTTIKKSYENYENQNYLIYKIQQNSKNKKSDTKYTTNKELRKIDFGSDGFYIERDYKYFFYENKIKKVKLENVAFSNFRDNNLEGKNNRDFETINNLIGKNNYGNSIKEYDDMEYPIYIMDMKTFNGIFCVNYGYENVTAYFKHYFYKIEKEDDKIAMEADIKCIKDTFLKLENNIKNLSIIINGIKEQKEFYCLAMILNFLIIGQSFNNTVIEKIPDKRNLEKRIGKYFTKEKNENDELVYSDFNYYNKSEEEEKMVTEKQIKIGNFVVKVDIKFSYFEEDI